MIKRELAGYRPGVDAFEGLRPPSEKDVERARLELDVARLDAEIAVMRRIVHAERTERLERLGIDTTNYLPLRDAPAPRNRGRSRRACSSAPRAATSSGFASRLQSFLSAKTAQTPTL